MSLINSTAIPSGATDYELEQSLRFDNGATEKLTFTPGSAGNTKLQTVSVWVKRGNLGSQQGIISAGGRFDTGIVFDASDNIQVFANYAENYRGIESSAAYRDCSAWYHIVASFDTNNATSTNRFILWVNGVRQAVGEEVAIPQNVDTKLFSATEHTIGTGGRYQENTRFDGLMAEMHAIDGQVLAPTAFGEYGDYGEWKPIEYSGSYGTNGFYLPFKQDYTVEGFSTVIYKGNATAGHYIGGTGFKPDMTWIKGRTVAQNPVMIDAVRGVNKRLLTNFGDGEATDATILLSFDTDGFSLGASSESNNSNDNFVAWNWDMGDSNASNTAGSINSTVRANTAYGQSIVSYTGASGAKTIGHGLSSTPEMIIVKDRSSSQEWLVYHANNTAAPETDYLRLDTTGATADNTFWNDTAPTSSVFSVGDSRPVNSGHGDSYIAYCFHSVSGYSKFGTYTGDATTNNSKSVTLGFQPAFLMVKKTSGTGNWVMVDNTRNPNVDDIDLYVKADTSDAEATQSGNLFKFTSTGFTIGANLGDVNANGATYIYMAFADKREYAYWLDQSGNNNDWTSNNLTESDVMVDSPTNNFATWNPLLYTAGNVVHSEGNLKAHEDSNASYFGNTSTMFPTSGKWYAEIIFTTLGTVQMGFITANSFIDGNRNLYSSSNNIYLQSAQTAWQGTSVSGGSNSVTAIAKNNVLQLAWDVDNGRAWYGVNGTWQNSSNPATGSNYFNLHSSYAKGTGIYTGLCGCGSSPDSTATVIANFGQDSSFAGNKTAQGNQDSGGIGDFYYTPPSGFLSLCSQSLPDVAVIPSEHFSPVIYTGDGTSGRDIVSGVDADMVWIKSRNHTYSNEIFDSVRGVTKRLITNSTGAESTKSGVTAFNTNGFELGSNSSENADTKTFVAWNWKAGTSVSGNSSGSGTAQSYTGSVNTDAGFSIIRYLGNQVNGHQIPHHLSAVPDAIFIKSLTTQSWNCFFPNTSMGATKGLQLDNTGAQGTVSHLNNTMPSTSVVTLGSGAGSNTRDGDSNPQPYIMYSFANKDGYSKVGSFSGNSNADGTFVYCGFRPALVIQKGTDHAHGWQIWDNKRDPHNVATKELFANNSNVEYTDATYTSIDFVSNGFKLRTSNSSENSGENIFIAFAETPFKYSNAR